MSKSRALFKKWLWRYIKYNIIGLTVFALNIVIYVIIFPFLGEWSYIIVSLNGGIIEFTLIAYVNRTKIGIIFDACTPSDSKSTGVSK
ncbi:MAG: hypothetical protein ABSG33_05310 [Candidatus Bathyarchaeia archaeon]